MSTIESPKETKRRHRSIIHQNNLGMCLNCGTRLTLCGRPFTAEIQCSKCCYINIFQCSKQPVSARGPDCTGFRHDIQE